MGLQTQPKLLNSYYGKAVKIKAFCWEGWDHQSSEFKPDVVKHWSVIVPPGTPKPHKDVIGRRPCPTCDASMSHHGVLATRNGGVYVCPGDYVIFYPDDTYGVMSPKQFSESYRFIGLKGSRRK